MSIHDGAFPPVLGQFPRRGGFASVRLLSRTKSAALFALCFQTNRGVLLSRHHICDSKWHLDGISGRDNSGAREKTILRNRILVIEDEPILQKNIAISLRREGYEVMEAGSGADAWKILNVASIDLLILDIGLPDYDGLNLLREIRAVHPRLPAIVMTARDAPEVKNRAFESGAAAFLAKPIILKTLKTKIRNIEEKRSC